MKKIILVIDGQGGGIGSSVVRELRKSFGEAVDIVAVGTNSIATAAMLGAGANRGATGENAIVFMAGKAAYIAGSLNIIHPNSMLGEMTSWMVAAVCESPARKLLLPLTQENMEIVGSRREPLPHLVRELAETIKNTEEAKNVRG